MVKVKRQGEITYYDENSKVTDEMIKDANKGLLLRVRPTVSRLTAKLIDTL